MPTNLERIACYTGCTPSVERSFQYLGLTPGWLSPGVLSCLEGSHWLPCLQSLVAFSVI